MNPDFANKGRHRTTQHLQLQSLLVDSVDMAPYAAKSAVNQDLGSQRRFLCLVHHRFSASQLPGPLLPLRHGSSEAMQAPLPMCGTQSMRDGRSSSKASHASGPPGSKAEDPWFFSLVILGVSAPASALRSSVSPLPFKAVVGIGFLGSMLYMEMVQNDLWACAAS